MAGLYAAPGALLLYAMFGSSRHLIVGPMSATAALSASIVATVAVPGADEFTTATAALAICVGIAGAVGALLRLGFLTNFISEPVLKGFIVGLALTIVIGQVPGLLGLPSVSGDFFERLAGVVRQLEQLSVPTTVVGLASLPIVLGLKELAPVLPGSLMAVAVGLGSVHVVARNQGQVRGLIRRDQGTAALQDTYPSIARAMAELSGCGHGPGSAG